MNTPGATNRTVSDADGRRKAGRGPAVGLSDFKVDLSIALPEDPQRPLMAVLLDTPVWASLRTVMDCSRTYCRGCCAGAKFNEIVRASIFQDVLAALEDAPRGSAS